MRQRPPLRPCGTDRSSHGDAHGGDNRDKADQQGDGVGSKSHLSADIAVDAKRQNKTAPTSAGSTPFGPFTAATEPEGRQGNRNDFFPSDLNRGSVCPGDVYVFE